jgi:hypothetical protein
MPISLPAKRPFFYFGVRAKETFPANFSRDIATAVNSGLIGAVTPRTYKVGRTGWNKIAESIAKLSA